jgi:hypothetical protein
VRCCRYLLADALNVVARIEDADCRINVVKVDDQLPQYSARMRNLPGDLRALLDEGGKRMTRSTLR